MEKDPRTSCSGTRSQVVGVFSPLSFLFPRELGQVYPLCIISPPAPFFLNTSHASACMC